jgi:hypothetical protein
VADAYFLVAFDVVRDLRWRARERTARSAREVLGFLIIVPPRQICESDTRGVAARFQGMTLDSRRILGILLRRSYR